MHGFVPAFGELKILKRLTKRNALYRNIWIGNPEIHLGSTAWALKPKFGFSGL
jgi:hypothetical protein